MTARGWRIRELQERKRSQKEKTHRSQEPLPSAELVSNAQRSVPASVAMSTRSGSQTGRTVAEYSVYEYLNYWLLTYKRGTVKVTTYDTLERVIASYIKGAIGDIPLQSLTSEDIQGLIVSMKEVDGYSHSTVKKVYDCLKAALTHAHKRKVIAENPILLVNMPAKSLFPATDRVSFFTQNECARIIEEASRCYSTGRPVYTYGDAIILILLTGIRLGEAIGLHREDYDPDRKVLTVRRSVQKARKRDQSGELLPGRILQESTTKSYSGNRDIPLTDQAVAACERLLAYGDLTSTYLIQNTKGQMATPEQVDRTFHYLLKNIGLPAAGVHKLRHTFASLLFSQKIDVKTISKLLGHASPTITLTVYVHIADQLTHAAVTPLDALF